MELFSLPLQKVLGKAAAKLEQKLHLKTVGDLLYYFPRRYHQKGELTPFKRLVPGEEQSVIAQVLDVTRRRGAGGKWILTAQLSDGEETMNAVFFAKNQYLADWISRQIKIGTTMLFSGRPGIYRNQRQLTHPTYQEVADDTLNPQENLVAQLAADRPEPIYSASAGLPTWSIAKAIQTVLDLALEEDLPEVLPPEILQSEQLLDLPTALKQIHLPADPDQYQQARRRFKFEEAFILQVALAKQKAQAASHCAIRLPARPDGVYQQVVQALPFELTSAQNEVLAQLDRSLDDETPLNALLQGDVGAGKTVIALLAMLRAVDQGYQAVMMAPTEVLVEQHARTLRNLLGSAYLPDTNPKQPVPLWVLSASLKTSARRQVLADLASGAPGIALGTHALLSDQVIVGAPGLVVIDEQHRFGVKQRGRLQQQTGPGGALAHQLVMTATPIPRTVAMTSFGDLDTLILPGVPAGRKGVKTFRVPTWKTQWLHRTWQRAQEEIVAGGRVFVVCPKIAASQEALGMASVEEVVDKLRRTPEIEGIAIGMVHGKMSAEDKEQAMSDFVSGETPILVATTVIEVGVDVPQATMMVIMDADRFGLAQLHQLRGRIGRGDKPGVCMLWSQAVPGSLADRRLEAFAETSDGFKLAQMDLQLRETGNILGSSQAGHYSGLKMLDLLEDEDLIVKARSLAKDLVNQDPDLSAHPVLAAGINRAFSAEEQSYLSKG